MRERRSTGQSRLFKICVIAVLASIAGVFVIIVRQAKEESKIRRARNEIRALLSAIAWYESKYDAPPVSDYAKTSVAAVERVGTSRAARTPMIAITTSSSINVKARRSRLLAPDRAQIFQWAIIELLGACRRTLPERPDQSRN
jgi:hypothetical protein